MTQEIKKVGEHYGIPKPSNEHNGDDNENELPKGVYASDGASQISL